MAGGGSSELRAALVQIRQLDARLCACEKELVRLARKVSELVSANPEDVTAEARVAARAADQALSVGVVGKRAKKR